MRSGLSKNHLCAFYTRIFTEHDNTVKYSDNFYNKTFISCYRKFVSKPIPYFLHFCIGNPCFGTLLYQEGLASYRENYVVCQFVTRNPKLVKNHLVSRLLLSKKFFVCFNHVYPSKILASLPRINVQP